VILIGVSTYYIWYIAASKPSAPAAVVQQQAAAPERVSVKISNFQFEPKDLTIKAGTVVEWTDALGRHTVEADDGSFKSDTLTAGGTYEHKFDAPGVFPYFCGFHGDKHGVDMAGVITVESR
jgi:plastocyanin